MTAVLYLNLTKNNSSFLSFRHHTLSSLGTSTSLWSQIVTDWTIPCSRGTRYRTVQENLPQKDKPMDKLNRLIYLYSCYWGCHSVSINRYDTPQKSILYRYKFSVSIYCFILLSFIKIKFWTEDLNPNPVLCRICEATLEMVFAS